MIIIIESGATKTSWCAVQGKSEWRVRTAGMNVSVMQADVISSIVEEAVKGFASQGADVSGAAEVHFYAAGLLKPSADLVSIMDKYFPVAGKEYVSDLLAAARSVCGHAPGIAVILGTGSNSCFFDGAAVGKQVHCSGFILGDEGSGAVLGRNFMSDYLKDLVPSEIAEQFGKDFQVDYPTVVGKVYRGEAPSKYLGSFAPWILQWYGKSEYVRNLVDSNFNAFIDRALLQYEVDKYPVGVVGGFGYANREIFRRLGEAKGIRFSTFIAEPIDGLVAYHTNAI